MVEDATKHPRFKYFREAGNACPVVPRRAAARPRDDSGCSGRANGGAARPPEAVNLLAAAACARSATS